MEWKTYRISEIGQVVGGGTPSTTNETYWGGAIPWISPKDLTGYTNLYISNGESNITEEGLKKSSAQLLPTNTLLFTSRAPIGYMAIAANPICTNQGFKSIVCNQKIVNPIFLYYYLRCNLNYIKLYGTGATFPEISCSVMKKIKISLPPLPTQRRIASILSSYDNLIETNNRRIKLLEQMAEMIYKNMFALHKVQKTAKQTKIKDFVKLVRGISYSSDEIDCDEGNNLINLKNIQAFGGFRLDGTKKYSGKYKPEQIVKTGDLIMGVTDMTQDRRTVGAVALIPNIEGINVISADLVKLVSDIDSVYLYAMFRYGQISKHIAQFANGANVLHLRPQSIENVKVLLPNKETIDTFVKIAKPIQEQIFILQTQNANLARQRDMLLPRLMSGKIELK